MKQERRVKQMGGWAYRVHQVMLREGIGLTVAEIVRRFGEFPGKSGSARVIMLAASSGFFRSEVELLPPPRKRGASRVARYWPIEQAGAQRRTPPVQRKLTPDDEPPPNSYFNGLQRVNSIFDLAEQNKCSSDRTNKKR